jgi:hypothetical protein
MRAAATAVQDHCFMANTLPVSANTAATPCPALQRAVKGLPAEPGHVPDEVRFAEDAEDADADAATAESTTGGDRVNSGAGASTSNAAAAAAAGRAAAALPASDPISTTPRGHATTGTPRAMLLGGQAGGAAAAAAAAAGAVARNVLGGPVEVTAGAGDVQTQSAAAAAGPSGAAAAAAARVAEGLEAWQGRVAVVTGASSGIGWAVCEALGRAGLRVVAVARRR